MEVKISPSFVILKLEFQIRSSCSLNYVQFNLWTPKSFVSNRAKDNPMLFAVHFSSSTSYIHLVSFADSSLVSKQSIPTNFQNTPLCLTHHKACIQQDPALLCLAFQSMTCRISTTQYSQYRTRANPGPLLVTHTSSQARIKATRSNNTSSAKEHRSIPLESFKSRSSQQLKTLRPLVATFSINITTTIHRLPKSCQVVNSEQSSRLVKI